MSPARASRLARILWAAWAIVVWNVVFDRVIVMAGRDYLAAARSAAAHATVRPNMDDYMRPAVTRALWLASASGGVLFVAGLVFVRAASRPSRHVLS
jgi:hypothetical protein